MEENTQMLLVGEQLALLFFINLMMIFPVSKNEQESVANALLNLSRLQVEIAVLEYCLVLERQSIVALAAILN